MDGAGMGGKEAGKVRFGEQSESETERCLGTNTGSRGRKEMQGGGSKN